MTQRTEYTIVECPFCNEKSERLTRALEIFAVGCKKCGRVWKHELFLLREAMCNQPKGRN